MARADTNRENGKKGGRPKGTTGIKHALTITKEQAREAVRTLVLQHMTPMVEAQIDNAKGLKYLVTRDKGTGKFIRVTEAMAKLKQEQDDNHEIIEVWEKDPSVQAFTDLLNRALDKPKEQEQELNIKGGLVLTWQ